MTFLFMLILAVFGPAGLADRPAGADGPASVEIRIDRAFEKGELPAVTPARGKNPPLVVIDPGHGGRDPGASSPYASGPEKAVTLALARAIRDELARSGRVRAALTRDGDAYLPLQQRYEIARALGADLFVSVHADASGTNDQARGATIYTLSEVASDRAAALLAQRQNEADLIAGVRLSPDPDVNLILIDLAQRQAMNVSADFARLLHREAQDLFPFRPDWHRFAAFVVLKAPDIPSVLFESGYLTNQADADYVQSEKGRRQIAQGMRRAIEAHFARRFLPGA